MEIFRHSNQTWATRFRWAASILKYSSSNPSSLLVSSPLLSLLSTYSLTTTSSMTKKTSAMTLSKLFQLPPSTMHSPWHHSPLSRPPPTNVTPLAIMSITTQLIMIINNVYSACKYINNLWGCMWKIVMKLVRINFISFRVFLYSFIEF